VALAPGAYEALFPSLSHTDAIIDQTLEILAQAAVDLR
jgi:glutamate-1-semialdehyde aminotransferase